MNMRMIDDLQYEVRLVYDKWDAGEYNRDL